MIHLDTCNISVEDKRYINVALNRGHVSKHGPYVERFENACKDFLNAKYACATNSGTTALYACLKHIGVEGKEVIIPALTFVATKNAVLLAGGIPVVVDVDPDTWCMDVNEVEKVLSYKVAVILPVHLYGNVCDMDKICELARRIDAYVVEDACQSFGSPNENWGHYQCYSFNGNKTITTGAGGMITSNYLDLTPIRELIDNSTGIMNGRMPNLNAALGLSQMERIDEFIKKKYKIHKWYQKYLPKDTVFQKNNGVPWMTTITTRDPMPSPIRYIFKPLKMLDNAQRINSFGYCLPSSTLNTKKDIKEYCDAI